ncbi:MAG: ion transporter [Opitutales bacterium]
MVSALQRLVRHPAFEGTILGIILVAAVVVGLETSPPIMATYGPFLRFLDKTILGIFVIEILVRMGACWPKPWQYFRSGWNVFDFTIVAVCLLPAAGPWIAVMRLARVLRATRIISRISRLRVLVTALIRSLPSMGYVGLLIGLHFYVYAVLGVFFFRGNDPGHFGDLGSALLTLFRVVTLEDWTDVMYSAIHGTLAYPAQGPVPVGPDPQAFGFWAVLYFVSFVAVGALVMINLLVGVMVNSISDAQADRLRESLHLDEAEQREAQLLESVETLETEIKRLRDSIERRG